MKISKKWTKLDNRGESDVEFVFVAFLIVMISIFVIMFYYVFFSDIEVHAAESETEQSETMTEYTFYCKKAITSSDHGDGFVQATLTFSAPSHVKIFGLRDPREGYDEFFIYAIDDTRSYGVSRWVNCNYDNNKCVKTFSYDDGYVSTSEEFYCTLATSSSAIYIDMFSKSTFEFGSYNFFTDLEYSLSPNIPLFDTYEAALSFVRDGDTSGQVNKPESKYNSEHDFTNDRYYEDIPTPELKNVSHNGFNVFNSAGYYLDIICESKYYGVKFEDLGFWKGGWTVSRDNNWVYSQHYYNFTTDNRAINLSTVNIADFYGVDNEKNLIYDMKKFSKEYPDCEDLPSYSFGRADSGTASHYHLNYVYSHMVSGTDSAKLKGTGLAQTTWYVRFYDKDMHYGKWKQYILLGGGTAISRDIIGLKQEDYLTTNDIEYNSDGEIVINTDGNPVISNSMSGVQNSSTGITDYSGTSFDSMEMEDFKSGIQSMIDSIGEFPAFIGKLFSFLPSWVLVFISIGIGAVVLLRFLGR